MKILFIDDDEARLRSARALLQSTSLAVAAAFESDTYQVDKRLAETEWDIVVAGVDSPRSMGAAALRDLETNYPTIARLAHSKVAAAREHIGAHMFLPQPFTGQQLRQALYGTVRWRDRLGSASISQLVTGARELPRLPEVYEKIQAELNSDDPSMHKIGQIIQADAATSVQILRIVNSALYGLRTEVGDVVQAASLLGIKTITSLTLAASLFTNSDLDHRFMKTMWLESLQVGALARRVARDLELHRSEIEEAQLAGLLHDIGDFVMFQNWPEDYLAVDPASWAQSEIDTFGATHADIGGFLTAVWELPVGVVDAVANHHTPLNGRYPHHPSPVTAVHVARALLDTEGDVDKADLDREHIQRIGRTPLLDLWADALHEIAA